MGESDGPVGGRLREQPAEEIGSVPLFGMTTEHEQRYFERYARQEYEGRGAIVDLGCWLGSTTIPLARGLARNPRREAHGTVVHAYDLFRWEAWMDAFVEGTGLAGRFRPGDSFLGEFRRRIEDVVDRVVVHVADLREVGWEGGPIEFLLIDAMKSWELVHGIQRTFFPHLVPGRTLVVHQDFTHHHTPWIHLAIYRLREHFELAVDVPESSSVVFRYVRPIPPRALRLAYSGDDFAEEEVVAAFRHSRDLVSEGKRPGIAAAHVMYHVHQQDLRRARSLLEAYLSSGLRPDGGLKAVVSLLAGRHESSM